MKFKPIRERMNRKERNSKKIGTSLFLTVELKKEIDKVCDSIGVSPQLLIKYLLKDLKDFDRLSKDVKEWKRKEFFDNF